MDGALDVYLDWQKETVKIGRLWTCSKGNKQTSSFEYTDSWRGHAHAFALDPVLPLTAGTFHTEALFNAFTDPAPDRWGRNLLTRRERKQARVEGRTARTLLDIDFLTLVEDRIAWAPYASPTTVRRMSSRNLSMQSRRLSISPNCSPPRRACSTTRRATTIFVLSWRPARRSAGHAPRQRLSTRTDI